MLAKPKEIETTKTKKVFSKQKSNVPIPIKSLEEAGVSEIANPEEVLTELKASTV
jgi:hypothetical protein